MMTLDWFVEKMRYFWPSRHKLEAERRDLRVTGILLSHNGGVEHVVNWDVRVAMDRLFDTIHPEKTYAFGFQRPATHATYFELVRKAAVTRDSTVVVTPLEPVA